MHLLHHIVICLVYGTVFLLKLLSSLMAKAKSYPSFLHRFLAQYVADSKKGHHYRKDFSPTAFLMYIVIQLIGPPIADW